MFRVTINSGTTDNYYNLTLAANDNSHYINIYATMVDNNAVVTISKSEDSFYFKSPCEEGSNLQLATSNDLEMAFNIVKKHFVDKGYKLSTY